MDLNRDAPAGTAPMPEFLLMEHFDPHIGKVFHFEGTDYALPLFKIVSSDQPVPEGMKRRPFTLLFRAPRQCHWLPEGFYRCRLDDGLAFQLYVAPIQTLPLEFQDYQAVFN